MFYWLAGSLPIAPNFVVSWVLKRPQSTSSFYFFNALLQTDLFHLLSFLPFMCLGSWIMAKIIRFIVELDCKQQQYPPLGHGLFCCQTVNTINALFLIISQNSFTPVCSSINPRTSCNVIRTQLEWLFFFLFFVFATATQRCSFAFISSLLSLSFSLSLCEWLLYSLFCGTFSFSSP